jgi:ABC-2 type transport system permease protein
MLLPAGFMILLLVSVMTGGQYLLTTTIEEKSSRVVEVLLSAVSPMQLMTGKIIGQMAVGLVILGIYAGMGVAGLVSFAMLGLLDLMLLVYLLIFYVIAYFVLASMMAAIGSAVTEMREAQTLMTPVMVMIMIPWLLWLPITRNPNSTFAVVTSFIPPINTFVMMLRMTSTSPPPLWQVWLSIAIGLVSVYAALWFAAKVFRVGLLMFGKPPNFATLIKWVKMA